MKDSLETTFRENLRFYRNRKKLSQEKLSALLDKNINYINMIEGGKSIPPLSMIEKIAEILDIKPYSLLISHNDEESFDKGKFIDTTCRMVEQYTRETLENLLNLKNDTKKI